VIAICFTTAAMAKLGCGTTTALSPSTNVTHPAEGLVDAGVRPDSTVAQPNLPETGEAIAVSADAAVIEAKAKAAPRGPQGEPTKSDLEQVTAEIYPDDPVLTAAVLSRYLSCGVLARYYEASQSAIRAEKDAAQAIARAEKEAAEATARGKKAEKEARDKAALAKTAAERALSQLEGQYQTRMESTSRIATMNLVPAPIVDYRVEPMKYEIAKSQLLPRIAPVGYREIPATRKLPKKAVVRPFDVQGTMKELPDWKKIAKAWPGGCRQSE